MGVWYLAPRVAGILLGRGSVTSVHVMGGVGREPGFLHVLIRGVHICRVPGPGLFAPGAAFGERREGFSTKLQQTHTLEFLPGDWPQL